MKKRRPPRPRKKKARQVSIGVEPKGKGQEVPSTIGTRSVESSRPSNILVERTTGQLVTPALREKEAMQADAKLSRPATISAMTNARGWTTFAGFIISCMLLASVVVMFAKYWT